MDIQEITDKLLKTWLDFKEINIAYLFGSHATGETRKTSDIDIAIVAPELTLDGYMKLWAKVTNAFGTEKVDLVTLSDKSASFRYEVVKEGMVIYYKDDDLLNDFELRSWQEYMDFKHIRGIYRQHLYEGLSHGV
ncbi:MAG: nucleotidyltransferase domain-containing protein [Deltaproteobacteria bacterium]|nr:nucleotidyltransferase domain-containing protein [Deltaproteobacteria bacterium]